MDVSEFAQIRIMEDLLDLIQIQKAKISEYLPKKVGINSENLFQKLTTVNLILNSFLTSHHVLINSV